MGGIKQLTLDGRELDSMILTNVILPDREPTSRWDVEYDSGTVTSISKTSSSPSISAILLPTLCHPHIHLDKAYLLTSNSSHHPSQSHSQSSSEHPDYSDLTPQSGSFSEALTFTSRAKSRYTPSDLYLRGSQLITTSLSQGVTSIRAFVELDHVTATMCLETAIRLKQDFEAYVFVQICAFAQDPLFTSEHGDDNRRILVDALEKFSEHVDVLGTTPYVESTYDAQIENIRFAIDTALQRNLHLDFHLDYNLDETQAATVWDVVRLLKEMKWTEKAQKGKTIVLGHCSRLTLFTRAEWERLAAEIREAGLPVHFVGLPTSDLFMMGRPKTDDDGGSSRANRARGTLQVLDMITTYGLDACIGVNNVGNAFTPWGTGDPITLASFGVGIYQAGTADDANVLWGCVSTRARRAIGLEKGISGQEHAGNEIAVVKEGRVGELLLIENEEWVEHGTESGFKVPARQRVSVKDVVWDPPEIRLRRVLR